MSGNALLIYQVKPISTYIYITQPDIQLETMSDI